MTKQEFKELIEVIVEDIQDPDSELNEIVREGSRDLADIAVHDQGLADRMKVIIDGFVEIGRYVRERGELK